MSRRVGSPKAAETAATAALKRPSSVSGPAWGTPAPGTSATGAELTVGSLPKDRPRQLGRCAPWPGWAVVRSSHQLRTRECMGIDQPQLEAALGAIVEPELGRQLSGTG